MALLWLPVAAFGQDVNKNGVSANSISLPSGPGSIEGLGEAFQPTLNTGTGKHAVNIKVPPGTAGHQPGLVLFYEGGEGNGPLGYGWQMPSGHVQRQTDKGSPRYVDGPNGVDDDHDGVIDNPGEIDTFITGSAEELVPVVDGPHTSYFCENEGSFNRYRRVGDHWESRAPDGTRFIYGESAAARISDPADPGRVFRWLLEKSIDPNGNEIRYGYTAFATPVNSAQKYLSSVAYGAGAAPWGGKFHFVHFNYEDRADWFEDCRSGFPLRTGKRLVAIHVGTQGVSLPGHLAGDFNEDGTPDSLNRRYAVAYHPVGHASLVESIRIFGADNNTSLPPARYGYTICNGGTSFSAAGQFMGSLDEPPVGFEDTNADFVDLNGDGLPDLLRTNTDPHRVYLNQGEREIAAGGSGIRWSAATTVSEPATGQGTSLVRLSQNEVVLADVDGDGLSDLVRMPGTGITYFYRNQPVPGGEPSWGPRTALDATDFPPPSPYGTGGHVRSLDVDFDKRMDIIRSQSSGGGFDYQVWFRLESGTYSQRTSFSPPNGFDLSDPRVKSADLNGDRLQDFARIGTQNVQVTMSLGNGSFMPLETIPIPGGFTLMAAEADKATLEDVNGDGLADLVIVRPEPGALWIWPNRGNRSFGSRITITGLPPVYSSTNSAIRWADINGNGTTDLVFADQGATGGQRIQALDIGRLMGCVPKPYLLNHVENGIGRTEEIIHTTTTEFILADGTAANGNYSYAWPHPLPFPVTVIKEIRTSDSLGGSYVTAFRYHDGYYDPLEKQFRGFARVEQFDYGDVTAPTLVSRSYFDVGDSEEALKGKLLRVTAEDEGGQAFKDETSAWDVRLLHTGLDARTVRHARPLSTTTDILEQGRGTPRRTYTEFSFDDYGNQTEERNYGIIEGANLAAFDDERITTTSFAYNLENWLIRYPYQTEVRNAGGTVINRTRTYYDDESFSGSNPGAVTVGNATLVRQWTDIAGNAFIPASRTKYDAYGNADKTYDPLWNGGAGHWREIGFDPHFRAFPITETIHIGGSVAQLVTSASYDFGFGTMLSATDFNGNPTIFRYDVLSRPVAVVKPFDSAVSPTLEYDYQLAQPSGTGGLINFTEIRQRETAGGGQFLSREFFDGLGRKRLVKHEDEDAGKYVAKEVSAFNARRGVRSLLNPYQSNDFNFELPPPGNPAVLSEYDALGRAAKVTNQDGTSATTVYEPLVVKSFDENDGTPGSKYFGTPMIHHNDGLGRLVQVDEVVKMDDQGNPSASPVSWPTRYTYRADDVLLTLTDSQNNFKEFRYDSMGRKTFMDDPDRGEMHWLYDDASNVTQTTDHKGQIVRFTYDGANRLLTEDLIDEGLPFSGNHTFDPGQAISSANRPDVAWFYDSPVSGLDLGNGSTGTGANTLGQIAYIWDLSGEEHFSYDPRGRLSWQVKRLADPAFPGLLLSYRTGFTYDSADRIVTLEFPDGDHATHEYNNRLQLERIRGGPSGSIIAGMAYKPWDAPASCTYGDGVQTSYHYDSRLRLQDLDTVGPGNVNLIDFTYHFDPASNIDRIDDNRAISGPRQNTQEFTYDSLYRITGVAYLGQNGGNISYRYDRIGNMLEKSSNILHSENGLSVTNLGLMTYGGAEGSSDRSGRGNTSAGPHALTGVANGGRAYHNDRNGNMTLIDGTTYSWDFKDRMVGAEDGKMTARYFYDHSNRRVAKHVTPKPGQPQAGLTDSTFYINRYFELRPGEPPVKYVWNGDTRVARITGSVESEQRVQRFRLLAGWNLVGLQVNAATGTFDPATNPGIEEAKWWDAQVPAWNPLLPSMGVTAGTPLWLKSSTATTLAVAGPRAPPADLSLASGELRFAANPAGTALPLSAVPPNWEIWRFDAPSQKWQSRFIGDLSIASNELPSTWEAGEALLLRASNGATISVSMESDLQIRYYHQDHLGSSSIVTDAKGQSLYEAANYPFGGIRFNGNLANKSNYGFSQKERDAESDLYYFEARYLAPHLSRWISTDPLEASANLYSYSKCNPIRFVDPSGLAEFDSIPDGGLGSGDWLTEDRIAGGDRFEQANIYNLGQSGGSGEYNSIAQRASFYEWFQGYSGRLGHETRWAGAAAQVASAVDYLSAKNGGLGDHFMGLVISLPFGFSTKSEISEFSEAGNKAIFDDVFPKLGSLIQGPKITGTSARDWDAKTLAAEQRLIQPLYEKLSPAAYAGVQIGAAQPGLYRAGQLITGLAPFEGRTVMNVSDRWAYGMKSMGYQDANASTMPPP
jgi:RHS repeat-associated protein